MSCRATKVHAKTPDAVAVVAASTQVKKHLFFAYADEDESDVLLVEKLKNSFIQRRFRVYQSRKNEDINVKIANGIENAAMILVFPSSSFQLSKTGSKLLNYADQTKTPILTIHIYENFQPKGWLGAILAPTASCSANPEEILQSLKALGIETDHLVLGRDEEIESQLVEEYLFYGGTKLGNMSGKYSYSGQEFAMEFKFLGLKNGKVFGEGDDEVGAYTFAGQYKIEDGRGDIEMNKQYVGKHSVRYKGKMSLRDVTCVIEGRWEIEETSDKFSIHLTLPRPYTIESKRTSLTQVLPRHGTKVMISYCPCQYDLAKKITDGLVARGIPAICPPMRTHDMIKIAAQEAGVVVPLMSVAYEASSTAKYVLSYVDEAGIPIVPVKAQDRYTQSGWLGVICAGALWIRMSNPNDLDKGVTDLAKQLHPYVSDTANEEEPVDVLVDETLPQGYYVQWGRKFDMTFNMLAMINGHIAGEGCDEVGGFVINGKYALLPDKKNVDFQFKKHYIGQHDVQYCGTITRHGSDLFLDGTWAIDTLSDSFHLEVSRNQSSQPKGLHIMLSYQWSSQELVKRIAKMLKERHISIWFDIAGDMKGNINSAMASGVEGAAAIISFSTVAYSNSINCQKELTYARQLKRNIIPVLLESEKNLQSTWLGMIIGSLKKVDMQDENKLDSNFHTLVQHINRALDQSQHGDTHRPQAITRFEGGVARGKYYQNGQASAMAISFFSLREGRVLGQGNDEIGPFTMAGTYDNGGKIRFVKQYVGKHAVEYEGQLVCDNFGEFKIHGKWNIDGLTDDFSLESIKQLHSDISTKN